MDLFQIKGAVLSPLPRVVPKLEREIQRLLEGNLEAALGIRLVASEHSTGERHGGRIDTLGLDENNTPVIIEYKLSNSANVVTQGLFYLDWLVDHRGDFEILVHKRLDEKTAVDWTSPRVILVADSFTTYDVHAVAQMGRNIQLLEYKRFQSDILGISVVGKGWPRREAKDLLRQRWRITRSSVTCNAPRPPSALLLRSCGSMLGLGDDVTESPVKDYIAYRTTRNVCCLEVHREHLLLYLTLDPALGKDCPLCRDVTNIGHYGTGRLEVRVTSANDVAAARGLLERAYNEVTGVSAA